MGGLVLLYGQADILYTATLVLLKKQGQTVCLGFHTTTLWLVSEREQS